MCLQSICKTALSVHDNADTVEIISKNKASIFMVYYGGIDLPPLVRQLFRLVR